MDFSKLSRGEVIGAGASLVLLGSLFFLPWYSLDLIPVRDAGEADAFICGFGDLSCTGFETFPILRWLLIAGASAPLILAYIVMNDKKLSWAPGEMTMTVGFTAFVLLAYNGILDKPGTGLAEVGVSTDYGYWIALAASAGLAYAGVSRMMEAQRGAIRKAPGTV